MAGLVKAPAHSGDLFWVVLIALTTLGAVFAQVFSLSVGIFDIYPFLYLFPLIIVVSCTRTGGSCTPLPSAGYIIALVYLLGTLDASLLTFSTVWFFVFVTIGIVVSSYAVSYRTEEKKYQGIFENSQAGIFTADLSVKVIRDMNRQGAAMLGYSRSDLIGVRSTGSGRNQRSVTVHRPGA
jgi:PAS domain-containing protein